MSDAFNSGKSPEGQTEVVKRRGRRAPKHGEIGVQYGGRNFLRAPGQVLVVQDQDWHLVYVPDWDREGWMNFKLYYDQKAPKNMFNISVTARGLQRKRDTELLLEHFPDRLEWVEEFALAFMNSDKFTRPERGIRMIFDSKKGWLKDNSGKGFE